MRLALGALIVGAGVFVFAPTPWDFAGFVLIIGALGLLLVELLEDS